MNRLRVFALTALIGLALSATPAKAVILAPGGFDNAANLAATAAPSGTVVGNMTNGFTGSGGLSGSVQSVVIREAGGTLDFLYVVTNNASSTDAFARFST